MTKIVKILNKHFGIVIDDTIVPSTDSHLTFDGLYSDSDVWTITYNLKDSAVADYDIIYDGGNSQ